MLGNDIVDLQKAKAESNWQRNGYLSKIFTAEERIQILNSPDPDIIVWLLWSMKEATYKIVNRERLQRFYSPKKFSCQLNGSNGLVNFESRIFYTGSEISKKLIHTIASAEKQNLAFIQTYYTENKHDYALAFNTKSNLYYLEKDAYGIPNLVDKKTGESYAVSISHHGAYLAISAHFLLQKFSC